ncbi:AQP-1 [Fasciolopsis buskii]|uniref:AQP-1 n=1 Tax=Fasciolopsis buskii TaxID=27845 RepID=A0A8E0VI69_9TREM|nr:AQP-1 [Fasciolopsis buski]
MGDDEEYENYKATTATLPKCDWYHIKFMCRFFAAEALGLGMIVFLIACHAAEGSLASNVSGPVVASAAFAVAVWTVGPVSGPQITGALSLALLMTRRINFVYFILGLAGQLCGALVGVSLASRLVPGLMNKAYVNLHVPGPGVTNAQAFGMECICSFLLIVCCLSTLDEFRNPHWSQGHVTQFSVVVFLLILMLAGVLAKITGCGMNPAASLSAAIYNNEYKKIWIYIVAPFVGSIIAVLLWEMLLSNGASVERIKHWWTDPDFDRTKDYQRLDNDAIHVYDAEDAMLSIALHT